MIPQPIDQVPLFLSLSEDERELINSRLRHIQFNTNDTIFTSGKPSEILGVIAQGWVKLESESSQGRLALANLGTGSVIGEMDLLLNRPYSTSARAASATNLLVLYRQDLQDLILERPTIGLKFSSSLGARVIYLDEYLVTQRLHGVPLLSTLSEDEMRALASRLQFQSFQRGDTLFQAGAPGDAVFLIEEGSVRLMTTFHEGESFDEFSAGDLLGQSALITGKSYASTARAVTELNLWVLTRSDYQELLHEHPTIKASLARSLSESLGSQDQAKAAEQMRSLPLFADVETDALRDLASCLVLRYFPDGEMIYAEGTPGDAMYLIESGQVKLACDSTPDAQVIETKSAGQAFGEMALLTGRTRAEAAVALEDTTIWTLYKNDYDDQIVRHPSLSLALSRALSGRLGNSESEHIEHQLNEFKLLNGLSQFELKHVGEFVKPLRFRSGETVCFAGQNAQYIYLISRGEVREIAGGANGQAVILNLLGENESFGERAVVQGSSYPTTMQAVGEVECLTLAKPDFDRLLGRYPSLAVNLARRMAEQADQANQRSPLRSSPPPPRRGAARPAPPRAVTYPGAPRPGAPRPTSVPRSPTMSQPVPVQPNSPVVGVRSTPGKPWERASSSIMRPMPAANSRPISVSGAAAASLGASAGMTSRMASPYRTTSNVGPLASLAGLSTGAKVKLAIVGVFAFFLVIIVPLIIIVSFLGNSSAFAGFNGGAPSSRDLPLDMNGAGIQHTAMAQVTGKLAIRERTATPTLAPTAVPTVAPTRSAVKKPTAKPATSRSASVKSSVQPTAAAGAPVAAAAARAPLPPRSWDKRLGSAGMPLLQGIGVTDATVQSGQTFWRLTKMVFQDAGAESGNDHTIYISLFDENGQRVDDQSVVVSWDQSGALEEQRLGLTDQKPKGDYCNCNYNWPMYGAGYRVHVDGQLPSDQVYGMIMPEHRHVNYLLTFQRVVMP